jgi:hypothetical protein
LPSEDSDHLDLRTGIEKRFVPSPAIGIPVEVLCKNDRMIMSDLDRGAPPDDAGSDVVVMGPGSVPVFDLVPFGI